MIIKPTLKNEFLSRCANVKVPTLYKQYLELCDNTNTHIIDFIIDPDFSNCIDGLILVSLDEIKPKKIKRYIG